MHLHFSHTGGRSSRSTPRIASEWLHGGDTQVRRERSVRRAGVHVNQKIKQNNLLAVVGPAKVRGCMAGEAGAQRRPFLLLACRAER